MGPFWKTPLLDMRPGLPGRPRAGRRSPMNMHERLEYEDESLIGLYGVVLIMFVGIAAVLAVILQPSESSSGTLPIVWQERQSKLSRNNTKKAKNDLLPRYG